MSCPAVPCTLCIGSNNKPLPAEYDIGCLTTAAGAVHTCKVTNRVDGQVLGCRQVEKASLDLEDLYQVRLAVPA